MIAYSCVLDNSLKLFWEILVLTRSLCNLCGARGEQIFIHVVDGVADEVVSPLRDLGVNIVEIQPFDLRFRPMNKLRQLNQESFVDFDCVAFLDTDMEVLAPYKSADFDPLTVSGVPVFGSIPEMPIWASLLKSRNFPTPPRTVPVGGAGPNGTQTYCNNLNGGLYLIPVSLIKRLATEWCGIAQELRSDHAKLCGAVPVYIDQIAFGLAMAQLGLAANILPVDKNCPPGMVGYRPVCAIHGMAKFDHRLYHPDGTHIRKHDAPAGERLTALDEIVRGVNEDPIARPFHLFRSMLIEARLDDWAAAETAGHNAVATGQLTASQLYEVAKIMARSGNTTVARSLIDQAIEREPQRATYFSTLRAQLTG